MSSQQFSQEIKQDIQNIRRTGELNQQTIVTGETKVITSAEQSIATEMPIVTEKIVTKEYVPVTYEKVIQKIPVVVGQRVETGAPISQEKYVQGLNVEYVQNAQQTRVDLTPQMTCQSTGVQGVINQPLNMAAEKISQQVFTEQTGVQNQQFQNQQFQNQQFQNQQFQNQNQQFQNQQFQNQNQQFQNKQFQNQQNLPQQQVIHQVTEKSILETQNLQPGQVFGQQGFAGQPLQQGGFGPHLGQKDKNLEADLANIERNLDRDRKL
jgi:hypothetical protein